METEFKFGFEQLLFFVDKYLQLTHRGDYTNIDVEIVFNRDMAINESEMIQNCNNSKGTISDETILAHHPYVSDVEEEQKRLEEQREKEEPTWDKIPIKDGGNGGE